MTLIASAKITKDVPIFLPGEYVPVSVTIENKNQNADSHISWICLQLTLETLPGKGAKKAEHFIKRSKNIGEPHIICCDVTVQAGETKEFEDRLLIPNDIMLVSTLRGTYLKYEYNLAMAVQHQNHEVQVKSITFQLMNYPFEIPRKKCDTIEPQLFTEMEEGNDENHFREIVADLVDEFSFKPSGQTFKVDDPKGIISEIILPKMNYKFGDVVCGKMIFPQKNGSYCIEYLVKLQAVERIKVGLGSLDSKEHIQTLKCDYGLCAAMSSVAFRLPLDIGNNMCVESELVSLTYRLHFEFVTSDTPPFEEKQAGQAGVVGDLKVQTVEWNLPINVIGCSTQNAALFLPDIWSTNEIQISICE
uniref:Arrestin_C domain-containing protein n=1 Tax=Rhabditophanes sp. KR3021 TaxID=114890 RepID=A0AC35TP05_9BILA